jgi:16S rRNA processing protein RimM
LKRRGDWQAREVRDGKRHGKTVIAQIDGVEDRDQAAMLIDHDIAVDRDALPEAGDRSFYWADLEGLRVVLRDGRELGRVAYLMETGANDVLVVQGDLEHLVPFILDDVILDVDLHNGVISVDWEWD